MTFRAIKDPDATLDYSVDWSPWLGTDEITESAWEVSGPDSSLSVDVDTHTTTKTTVWLYGGTPGEIYSATNRVTTTMGRTDDRTIAIQMRQR